MLNLVKIREKSQILLGTLLFFFILSMTAGGLVGGANIMDIILDTGSSNGRFVGKVGDKKISRQEFLNARSNQLSRLRQQNPEISNSSMINAENSAWNSIVDKTIINNKIEELGLESYNDEIYNFMFYTPPPSLQNQLTDGGFFKNENDEFDIKSYQNALTTGNYDVDPEFWLAWENYLRSFLPGRKLQNLYNLTGSISDHDVKRDYTKKNLNCEIEFIYINTNDINDSLIELSDDEIFSEYEELKEDRFKVEKSKIVEYVFFENTIESEEDSLINDVYENALLFSEDAKFTSFQESAINNNTSINDTINVTESYTNNSGIPRELGTLRNVVRFAFDNPINSISDPIIVENGYAVFHISGENKSSYKNFDEVRENLSSQLIRKKKLEYAVELLKDINANNSLPLNALTQKNDLIKYQTKEEKNINGSFTAIGKSSSLTGNLLAMEPGDLSGVIETFSSAVIVKMISKDEFPTEEFENSKIELKSQLLKGKQNSGYNNWLVDTKKEIIIEDYRSTIF